MRLATLIIALVLMVVLFAQSVLVATGQSLGNNQDTGGAMGIVVAFVWLLAAAFVMAKPRLSSVLFAVGGLLAFAGAGSFPDLWIWGGLSLVLGLLAWGGHIEKRVKQLPPDPQRST